MKKRGFKIGVITANIYISNYLTEILAESDDEIMVSTEGLEKAIPVGKKMEKDGYEPRWVKET